MPLSDRNGSAIPGNFFAYVFGPGSEINVVCFDSAVLCRRKIVIDRNKRDT